jgi:hypothetical protein
MSGAEQSEEQVNRTLPYPLKKPRSAQRANPAIARVLAMQMVGTTAVETVLRQFAAAARETPWKYWGFAR